MKNIDTNKLIGYTAIFLYIVIVIVFSMLSSRFLTFSNIFSFLSHIAPLAIMTFGLAIIMIGGDFDLSFVGVAGFSAVLLIYFTGQFNIFIGIIVGLAVSIILGLINGLLVVKMGIHPWLATIAMMRMTLGLEQVVSGGEYVTLNHPITQWLGNAQLWVIPVTTILMFLIFLILYYLITKHKFGFFLYAVGGDKDAAEVAGLSLTKYRIIAYIIMGGLAFIGGFFLVGTLSGYTPTAAEPLLLDAILSVFIARSISRKDIINIGGALFGVVFMGTLTNGLSLIGVPSYWMQLVKGLLIVAVVVSTSIRSKEMIQI